MASRAFSTNSTALGSKSCTDPIVGAILSGWRYDISSISPEMRTDYEHHLTECSNCRRRQRIARTWDVLLISVSSLSIVAFLLMSILMHRLKTLTHLGTSLTLHLHETPVAISLQAVAMAGLVISMVLWVLVAIATPLPDLVQQIPSGIRQRFSRRHA
jgi:hypothetical protein